MTQVRIPNQSELEQSDKSVLRDIRPGISANALREYHREFRSRYNEIQTLPNSERERRLAQLHGDVINAIQPEMKRLSHLFESGNPEAIAKAYVGMNLLAGRLSRTGYGRSEVNFDSSPEEFVWQETERMLVAIYEGGRKLQLAILGDRNETLVFGELPVLPNIAALKNRTKSCEFYYRFQVISPSHDGCSGPALDIITPEHELVSLITPGCIFNLQFDSTEGGVTAEYANKDNFVVIQTNVTYKGKRILIQYRHLGYRDEADLLTNQLNIGTYLDVASDVGVVSLTGLTSVPHLHFDACIQNNNGTLTYLPLGLIVT